MNDARLMVREVGVLMPSNVGDAVLALPVVAELAVRFPKARLTLAGGPRAETVFMHDPRVSSYIVYGADEHGWRETLRAVRALRRQRFDLFLDVRHTLVPWLVRARWRTQPWRQPPAALIHRADRYAWYAADLLRAAGLTSAVSLNAEQLWAWTSSETHAVDALWRAWGIDAAPLVLAISPSARSDGKRWPAAQYAALCRRVAEELSAAIILTGESSESALIAQVAREAQVPAHIAAGQTTVRTLANLLHRCDGLITNDSAALHVGSTVHTPTVALFGPTDPAKYGPRSPRSAMLQRAPIAALTVDEVVNALRRCVHLPSGTHVA